MADIGKPLRRRQVIPLTEPVAPSHEPAMPSVPERPKEPIPVPEKVE
jgi:hypothetical protein